MPEYIQAARLPKSANQARVRRFAGAFQVPGSSDQSTVKEIVNTNATLIPPTTFAMVTTGGSDRTITLSDSDTEFYSRYPVVVKKMDDSAGQVLIDAPGGSIEGLDQYPLRGKNDVVMLRASTWGSNKAWAEIAAHTSVPTDPGGTLSITANATLAKPTQVVIAESNSQDITITLPPANTYYAATIYVKSLMSAAHVITIAGAGSDTIDGGASIVLNTMIPYESVSILSDGDNWHIMEWYK